MLRKRWHTCSPAMYDERGVCFCGITREQSPFFDYEAGSLGLSHDLLEASRIARERLMTTIPRKDTDVHGSSISS